MRNLYYEENWPYDPNDIKKFNGNSSPNAQDKNKTENIIQCSKFPELPLGISVYKVKGSDDEETNKLFNGKKRCPIRLPTLEAVHEVMSRRHADYTPTPLPNRLALKFNRQTTKGIHE